MKLRNNFLQILAFGLCFNLFITNTSFGINTPTKVNLNSLIKAALCLKEPEARDCSKVLRLLVTYNEKALKNIEQVLSENGSSYAESFKDSFCAYYKTKKNKDHSYCPAPSPSPEPEEAQSTRIEICPTCITLNQTINEISNQNPKIEQTQTQRNYLVHFGVVGASALTAGIVVATATYVAPGLFFASYLGGLTLGMGVGGATGGSIGYFVEDVGVTLGIIEGVFGGLIGAFVGHGIAAQQLAVAQQAGRIGALEGAAQQGQAELHAHIDAVRGDIDAVRGDIARLGGLLRPEVDAGPGGDMGPPSVRSSLHAPSLAFARPGSRSRSCSVASCCSSENDCSSEDDRCVAASDELIAGPGLGGEVMMDPPAALHPDEGTVVAPLPAHLAEGTVVAPLPAHLAEGTVVAPLPAHLAEGTVVAPLPAHLLDEATVVAHLEALQLEALQESLRDGLRRRRRRSDSVSSVSSDTTQAASAPSSARPSEEALSARPI